METSAEANFRTFMTQLDGLIRDCGRRDETTDLMEINLFIERIFILSTKATKLERACHNLPLDDEFRVGISDVATELRSLLKTWNKKRGHVLPKSKHTETFLPAGDVRGDGPGRPRKDIPWSSMDIPIEEILHEIIDLDYTVTDVAKKYEVDRSTVYRRLKDNGIDINQQRYSDISQQQIEDIVRRARRDHGFKEMGQKVMFGHLRSMGVRVKRCELRDACRSVDPIGTALRHPMFRSKITSHASYDGHYAQYIWHIDGVEKLQQYAIYSYSIVDGYSKKAMNVHVAGSKRTYHVFKTFYAAFKLYGIPSIVRMDHGYENKDVKVFMDAYHEREAGIQGQSIRNQPVEKFHQYEESYCLDTFKKLFREMEQEGSLDKTNSTHLMLLHYVFLPRINSVMTETVKAWNSHHTSTTNHHSPDRTWEDSVNSADAEERSAVNDIPPPRRAQKYDIRVDMSEFNDTYEGITEDDLVDPRVQVMPVGLKDLLDGQLMDVEENNAEDIGKTKYIRALQVTEEWNEGNNVD